MLRIAAIGCFYAVELLDYHGLKVGGFEFPPIVDRKFHELVTGLALAWALTGLAVLLLQKNRVFPAALKYGTTAADLFFLTWVLVLADGPQQPVGGRLLPRHRAGRAPLQPLAGPLRDGRRGGRLRVRAGTGQVVRPAAADRAAAPAIDHGHRLALTGVILGQIVRRAAGWPRNTRPAWRAAKEDRP